MDGIQIRYEAHEKGGSAWVSGDGEWYCVWSTAPGNVGETLPCVDDTDELLHNSYLVAAIPLPPPVLSVRYLGIDGVPIYWTTGSRSMNE